MSHTNKNEFDSAINILLDKKHLIGLSLSIIRDGKIIKEKGYGYTDKTQKIEVTPSTLFQAGSISKPVATLGVMHLVEKGHLSLDKDVNIYLDSWKVPTNKFTKANNITLRKILSHSAGFTVHGFPGYATTDKLPSLSQVLDGLKPANTSPIRVNITPGKKVRYSGGGFVVMQQVVIDVTRLPFSEFMCDTVLKPLGMASSTYEQPPAQKLFSLMATGYYTNGKEVKGRWHIYPEMAAAGLWTTASDLARYLIGIQQALNGQSNSVISPKIAKMMIKNQKEHMGLGLFLSNKNNQRSFFHGGRNNGFDSFSIGNVKTGQGIVILINKNVSSLVFNELIKIINNKYTFGF
jgi:CubicO group peptidase (beta-lactamase class C family)